MAGKDLTSFAQHPQYPELLRFRESNPVQARLAVAAYFDLCAVKNWLDVQIHHSEQRKLTYMSGREHPQAKREIVMPMSMHQTTSFEGLQNLFELPDPEDSSKCCTQITLAMFDSDSTNAYYRIFSGVVPPAEHVVVAGTDELE
eukprot:m.108790 g.108790  ORF g.108790 m.108790 type:complete len:144 (+) comp15876_c1_seq5:101-532(+)